jgi:hypothetical protein
MNGNPDFRMNGNPASLAGSFFVPEIDFDKR